MDGWAIYLLTTSSAVFKLGRSRETTRLPTLGEALVGVRQIHLRWKRREHCAHELSRNEHVSVALVRAACTVLGESDNHITRSYAHGKAYRLYVRVGVMTDRAVAPPITGSAIVLLTCDFPFVLSGLTAHSTRPVGT